MLTTESPQPALSEDDDLDEPPPEIEADPDRGFRRLLFAILLSSLEDYIGAADLQTYNAAKWFLFPESVDRQEHLRLLIEGAGLNPGWFRGKLEKLSLRITPPEGKATLNRFNVKERARQRCQGEMAPLITSCARGRE